MASRSQQGRVGCAWRSRWGEGAWGVCGASVQPACPLWVPDCCCLGTDKNWGAGALGVFGVEGLCPGFWLTFSGSLLGW